MGTANFNSADSLKSLLVDKLLDNNQGLLLANELRFGSKNHRADIVAVDDNDVYAYEIKSSADKISKFYEQYKDYCQVFDYVVLVTTYSMLKYIKKKSLRKAGLAFFDINGDLHVKYCPEIVSKKSKYEVLNSIPLAVLRKKFGNTTSSKGYRHYLSDKLTVKSVNELYSSYLEERLSLSNSLFMSEKGTKVHFEDLQLLKTKDQKLISTKYSR